MAQVATEIPRAPRRRPVARAGELLNAAGRGFHAAVLRERFAEGLLDEHLSRVKSHSCSNTSRTRARRGLPPGATNLARPLCLAFPYPSVRDGGNQPVPRAKPT